MKDVTQAPYSVSNTGATDAAPGINACLAAGEVAYLPKGTYLINSPLNLTGDGSGIVGDGVRATIIRAGNSTINGIVFGASSTGQLIRDLTITRAVQGASPACGIRQNLSTVSHARILNVELSNHFIGMSLSGTDLSTVEDVWSHNNTSHGIQLVSNGTDIPGDTIGRVGPTQWYFGGHCITEKNGGTGLLVQALAGSVSQAGFATGTISNVHGFANGAYGFAFIGTAQNKLTGVRVTDCFVGADVNDSLFLDTYGEGHLISGVFAELSQSRGIFVTANNKDYQLVNCKAQQNGRMGIASCGNDAVIVGCSAIGNGSSGATPWGLYLEGLRSIVSGGRYGNAALAIQQFGIVSAGGATGGIDMVNIGTNLTAPTGLSGSHSLGILVT